MNKITGNELAARGLEKVKLEIEVPQSLTPFSMPGEIEPAGIEETKDVVLFGVKFANAIIASFADGKITAGDIMNFINPMFKLPGAMSGLNRVPVELADLDENELTELIELVMDELECESPKAKKIVEESIRAMFAIFELVKVIKG